MFDAGTSNKIGPHTHTHINLVPSARRPWRRNPHSKLSTAAVEAAAAEGSAPAPADLPQNEFIYYVWVCEIMSQQVCTRLQARQEEARSVAVLPASSLGAQTHGVPAVPSWQLYF